MKSDVLETWKQRFPGLARSGDDKLCDLLATANVVRLPAGQRVFEPGGSCKHYLLVIDGSVRVQILAESGREVTLYHVLPGESCILTTSCLMGESRYPAEGITESEVTALALSATHFNEALRSSDSFRTFVFDSLGQRLVDVIVKMEQLAFGPIDARLAEILLRKRDAAGLVKATHHELANELGTAREVVSRHLKRFEARNWVELGRGTILIRAPEQLQIIPDNDLV